MEFPNRLIALGNIALILWIILGSLAFWLYNQVAGWLFLVSTLIATYVVLRFLGCLRPCYHCKKCTLGFGRLSALFFGKRSLKDPKESYRMGTAVFFYALLGPFPAVFLLASIFESFSVVKIVVLLCLLAISVYSGLTWRPIHKP